MFTLTTLIILAKDAVEILKQKYKYSEYDQEIPQSQTADKPMGPRGRDIQ